MLIILRGRSHVLPPHAFSLGRLGYVCNALSPILVAVVAVFVCLPPELPVTARSANYAPVVLLLFFVGILALWFSRVGKEFEGPKIDWAALWDVKVT